MSGAAFYAMSDSRYFVGLVALLNSLRLSGHEEPLFVLDCGLDAHQRERLAAHVHLVRGPAGPPAQLTARHVLAHPADVMIVVDADVVVTRSLAPLVAEAVAGRIVAPTDDEPERFHAEWGERLGLGPLRRHTYVNYGLVVLPRQPGLEVLELVLASQERISIETSRWGSGRHADAFYYYDQDILNAVLGMERWADRLLVLEHRLIPFTPCPGLRLLDAKTLACRYPDGQRPFAIHHVGRGKPWFARTEPNVYSRLLPRLVLADDLTLRLDEDELPLRFRSGARARLDLARTQLQTRIPPLRTMVGKRLAKT
jgi:hypothetical protein